MTSWTTPLLCLFFWRLFLAETGCNDHYNLKNWESTFNKTLFTYLIKKFSFVDASTDEERVLCALANEPDLMFLVKDCKDDKWNEEEFKKKCQTYEKTQKYLEFYNYICLCAKVLNVDEKVWPCTRDVAEFLYETYYVTKTSPDTTTNKTATTAQTTTKIPTKHPTISVSSSREEPTTSSAAMPTLTAAKTKPAVSTTSNSPGPDTITQRAITSGTVYLVVVPTVILTLFLLLYCIRRRSNHIQLVSSQAPVNRDSNIMEDTNLVEVSSQAPVNKDSNIMEDTNLVEVNFFLRGISDTTHPIRRTLSTDIL